MPGGPLVPGSDLSTKKRDELIVLQQHNQATSLPFYEIIESVAFSGDMRSSSSLNELLLFVWNHKTIERFRVPDNIADASNRKFHYSVINQLLIPICVHKKRNTYTIACFQN